LERSGKPAESGASLQAPHQNDGGQAKNKQAPNYKHQITNKFQIPSTKFQGNSKFQAPRQKDGGQAKNKQAPNYKHPTKMTAGKQISNKG
jgi:hypothetical protein